MRKLILIISLSLCSLKCASEIPDNCNEFTYLFNLGHQHKNNKQLNLKTLPLTPNIKMLVKQGLEDLEKNEKDSGYRSLEMALRMIRGNYGLYTTKQVKLLTLIVNETISTKNYPLYYKYQKILDDLVLRSNELLPDEQIRISIDSALSYFSLAFYDQATAPYQNLLRADDALSSFLNKNKSLSCQSMLSEALWLRSAVAYAIEQHFMQWRGDPVFGIVEEKVYGDSLQDPIQQLSRKNSILSNRKLGEGYLKEANRILKNQRKIELLRVSLKLTADWYLLHGNKSKFVEYRNASDRLKSKNNGEINEVSYFTLLNNFQSKNTNDNTSCELTIQKNGKVRSPKPRQNAKKAQKIDRLICRKLKTIVFRPTKRKKETVELVVNFDGNRNIRFYDKPIFNWAVIKPEKNIHPIWAAR